MLHTRKRTLEASEKNEADKEAVKQAAEEVKRAKAYVSHAKTTRNAPRLRAMLELSKSALVIKADELDANAFDLNSPEGIVNLNTGQIRPHDRGAYCTQITGASPSGQGADMWNSFLDTVTSGSGSVKGFLQVVAGMALIGAVYQEGIILAYGGGRNGKSTLFNALGQAFGTYSGGIEVKTLTTDRTKGHPWQPCEASGLWFAESSKKDSGFPWQRSNSLPAPTYLQ